MAARKTAAKKAPEAVEAKELQPVETKEEVTSPKAEEAKAAPEKKRELKMDMYVTVRNGVNGTLVYKSSRTGERFIWEHFGDEQDMELQELKNAKNSAKAFFENGWFLIDDPDVIAFLGLERLYSKALKYEEYESLLELPAEKLQKRLEGLSDAQKATLATFVRERVRDGKVDSLKTIGVLEKALKIDLTELTEQ